ncbi:MAG TPA: rod shape-determining protein RodA, partial [Bacteroidales bacterium]|nr:rod shape-determining protein RodA [Bacteroidales bacterium]
ITEEIDWTTVGLYLLLVIFGWMNIFASSYNEQFTSIFNIRQNYGDQLLWILVSFLMIIILFAIDHRFFHYFAYVLFGFSILLLLAVLTIGVEVNNSKSWIRIMSFNFQPSEFVKIAVALAIARFLSGYNIKLWTWKSMSIMALLIGLPVGLIILQPDAGTAMVFSCFILVMYREGMPGWILAITLFITILFLMTLLLPNTTVLIVLIILSLGGFAVTNHRGRNVVIAALILTGAYFLMHYLFPVLGITPDFYKELLSSLVLSSVIFLMLAAIQKIRHVLLVLTLLYGFIGFTYTVDYVFHEILKPHQQTRVNILLGKETDVRNVGYNLNQSKIAIGSGGFLGKGYLKGTQTKLDFVPEQSTDFIFCTVGEEWGFLGTTIAILLYTGLLIRLLYLAERQRSQFARIYGYGVVSILFFHFAINIGMTIGLFPVIGIPLPFFSYGGSSMLAFTLLLFILVRLDSVRKKYTK